MELCYDAITFATSGLTGKALLRKVSGR